MEEDEDPHREIRKTKPSNSLGRVRKGDPKIETRRNWKELAVAGRTAHRNQVSDHGDPVKGETAIRDRATRLCRPAREVGVAKQDDGR